MPSPTDDLKAHIPLAKAMAERFHRLIGRRGDRDDLEQVALLALVEAAGRPRTHSLAAYAGTAIERALWAHLRATRAQERHRVDWTPDVEQIPAPVSDEPPPDVTQLRPRKAGKFCRPVDVVAEGEHVSPAQAAPLLGLSVQRVTCMCRQGVILASQKRDKGRKVWVIPVWALQAAIEDRAS